MGAGPAGIYAAEALSQRTDVAVEVAFIDRLPVPFGLVRYGVALKGFESNSLLVVVYDMLGREMYTKIQVEEKEGFLFSFDPALPKGVYLIIASANDIVFRQKLIVK